jgi:hypothetical protein
MCRMNLEYLERNVNLIAWSLANCVREVT